MGVKNTRIPYISKGGGSLLNNKAQNTREHASFPSKTQKGEHVNESSFEPSEAQFLSITFRFKMLFRIIKFY